MNIKIQMNNIEQIALHRVGSKSENEMHLSKAPLEVDDLTTEILSTYFFSSFKQTEYYLLHHDTDLELNEVYNYASKIFDNPDSLFEQSVNIAKHLFEKSDHPKIKTGEFYVVYFTECIVNGEEVDAVGLFKSENKDTFLKVYPSGESFEVESQQGMNIHKLDKGCIIYNSDKENGYKLEVIDSTNRSSEAHYWFDEFLHVRQRKDAYYHTENVMKLAKNFVAKELPKEYEVSKADQAELLNKTTQFFKDKDTFDMEEFANEVIAQPEVIDSFNRYKESYQQERDLEIADSFDISDSAVKKQSRVLKSVIKLDKNFHIYVHGNNQFIKKGYDEATGMHFYQLFFKEEL